MIEISAKLMKEDVAICVKCGAIFEGREWETTTCPECKGKIALRWITTSHTWIESLKGGKR